MKKLLKKQGFTLVELIVVIAIMAILLAAVIPLLTTKSSFQQEARENARAFYSNVQELMIDEKLAGTKLNVSTSTVNSPYTLIYAQVTTPHTTSLAETAVSIAYANSSADFKTAALGETNAVDESNVDTKPFVEFENSLNKLLSASEDPGFYYAVVDDKYRVVYTYYSRYVDFDALKSASTFSDDFMVEAGPDGTNYLGAYPFSIGTSGKTVLPEASTVEAHA